MSTPDDDTDPTGMRALLRGLPDPGPMPEDLVERIQATLGTLAAGDEPAFGDRAPGEPPAPEVSRGTAGPHGSSWWVRNAPKVAVAAVVLVGGGALFTGPLGQLRSGDDAMTTSSDTAGGAGAESATESPQVTAQSGDDSGTGAQRTALGPVVVHLSGRSYSSAGLAGEVGGAEFSSPTVPLTAESRGIGPIGTENGVRSCLEALGLPRESAVAVDLGQVDGAPAAVLVVTTAGERTAYAVRRECTLGNPALVAGPVPLP